MNTFFVTAIGTGVGKTFVSAVLTAGLRARYWKPVQAGTEPETDFGFIKRVTGCDPERIIPPAYVLGRPESPHSAAAAEGIEILPFSLPQLPDAQPLIIEGAGGAAVPLNNRLLYMDLVKEWKIPVILVSEGYLGAINHTLLTVEALVRREIPIAGLIFNKVQYPSAKEFILNYTQLNLLGELPEILPSVPLTPELMSELFHKYLKMPQEIFG